MWAWGFGVCGEGGALTAPGLHRSSPPVLFRPPAHPGWDGGWARAKSRARRCGLPTDQPARARAARTRSPSVLPSRLSLPLTLM